MQETATSTAARPLSDAERAYIELDRRKAEVKKFFDELKAATAALVEAHGLGHYFQDDQGVVYRTVEPKGTFVEFKKFDVDRTRRLADGETKGSLSLKEAREHGFIVEE